MVSEFKVYDSATDTYGALQKVCGYDSTKLAAAQFTPCKAGQAPKAGILRLYIGRPVLSQDVIIYTFTIK